MDCRSDSVGKTDEGLGYDERNVKDNPSSVASRQLPPKGKPRTVRYRGIADEERPYHALSKVSTSEADLPAAAPLPAPLANGDSPKGIDISIFFEVRNYEKCI